MNWRILDYENFFVPSLPDVVRLYLGDELKKEWTKAGLDFFHNGLRVLTVSHRVERVGTTEFEQFAEDVLRQDSPAGLIVSWQSSPFRVRLLPKESRCWIPVVSWGRKQVSAIASLNRAELGELLPYVDYSPEGGSASLGAGSAIWTDIIRFKALGVQIGWRLGVDPADVRQRLLRDIDDCFLRAGGNNCTHHCKVGADGWYHFFRKTLSSNAVDLGISTQQQVKNLVSISPYAQTKLQVVMGANSISSCRVATGGPYDDDSIIAYELIAKFKRYDLRATDNVVVNVVDPSKRNDWAKFDKLRYVDGRTFDVYGHKAWP